jgi:hypothetical protein
MWQIRHGKTPAFTRRQAEIGTAEQSGWLSANIDYTGKRELTKGSAERCVASEDVSVTINGGALTFTDSALRDFSIGFNPHEDGSFGLISAAIGGTAALIQGRIVGGVLDADVTDGPCEHHWHLTKNRNEPHRPHCLPLQATAHEPE